MWGILLAIGMVKEYAGINKSQYVPIKLQKLDCKV